MTLSQKSILSANQDSLVMTSWFPISRYLWSSATTGSHVIPAGEPVEVGHFLHPTFLFRKEGALTFNTWWCGISQLGEVFPHAAHRSRCEPVQLRQGAVVEVKLKKVESQKVRWTSAVYVKAQWKWVLEIPWLCLSFYLPPNISDRFFNWAPHFISVQIFQIHF